MLIFLHVFFAEMAESSNSKQLTSFDSFEDLRSCVGDDELADFFGNGLKMDKKDATVRCVHYYMQINIFTNDTYINYVHNNM